MSSRKAVSLLGPPPPRAASRCAADFFSRREALTFAGAAFVAGCATHAAPQLTLYSPAPPTTPLHALNLHLRDALALDGVPMQVVAEALPASVNGIVARDGHRTGLDLPIVTTVDFRLARAGAGPDWHGYPRANFDLKFVAKLYDVGFGIQARDPRITAPDDLGGRLIGAPARPSAVRLLTEALLQDGWGVRDAVLVDTTPGEAAAGLASGELDAISWTLVLPTDTGFAPMLPVEARFLEADAGAIARMNAAGGYFVELVDVLASAPPLISFAQALAAWDATPAAVVRSILQTIEARGARFAGLPDRAADMARWPGLDPSEIHQAAGAFYAARGIAL